MNPEEEHKERGQQRTAFLCEVYNRTKVSSNTSVPYNQIAAALNFQEGAIAQACLHLQHEKYIEVYTSPTIQVIPPEGGTVSQPQSSSEKLIVLTEKGIALARIYVAHNQT